MVIGLTLALIASTAFSQECGLGQEFDSMKGACVPVSCEAVNACPSDKVCMKIAARCVRSPCPQFLCTDPVKVSSNVPNTDAEHGDPMKITNVRIMPSEPEVAPNTEAEHGDPMKITNVRIMPSEPEAAPTEKAPSVEETDAPAATETTDAVEVKPETEDESLESADSDEDVFTLVTDADYEDESGPELIVEEPSIFSSSPFSSSPFSSSFSSPFPLLSGLMDPFKRLRGSPFLPFSQSPFEDLEESPMDQMMMSNVMGRPGMIAPMSPGGMTLIVDGPGSSAHSRLSFSISLTMRDVGRQVMPGMPMPGMMPGMEPGMDCDHMHQEMTQDAVQPDESVPEEEEEEEQVVPGGFLGLLPEVATAVRKSVKNRIDLRQKINPDMLTRTEVEPQPLPVENHLTPTIGSIGAGPTKTEIPWIPIALVAASIGLLGTMVMIARLYCAKNAIPETNMEILLNAPPMEIHPSLVDVQIQSTKPEILVGAEEDIDLVEA